MSGLPRPVRLHRPGETGEGDRRLLGGQAPRPRHPGGWSRMGHRTPAQPRRPRWCRVNVRVPLSITTEMVRTLAINESVCVRPILRRVTDRATGVTTTVAIPCGCTRESRCPSCAKKARWLRMTKCSAGWHRDDEPDEPDNLNLDEPDQDDEEADEEDEDEEQRRVRSTRRRQD